MVMPAFLFNRDDRYTSLISMHCDWVVKTFEVYTAFVPCESIKNRTCTSSQGMRAACTSMISQPYPAKQKII